MNVIIRVLTYRGREIVGVRAPCERKESTQIMGKRTGRPVGRPPKDYFSKEEMEQDYFVRVSLTARVSRTNKDRWDAAHAIGDAIKKLGEGVFSIAPAGKVPGTPTNYSRHTTRRVKQIDVERTVAQYPHKTAEELAQIIFPEQFGDGVPTSISYAAYKKCHAHLGALVKANRILRGIAIKEGRAGTVYEVRTLANAKVKSTDLDVVSTIAHMPVK